jgi:hypothetical protein
MKTLLKVGQSLGFPGMLESVNCMHCKWKNYQASWKGMYIAHTHESIAILEVVASHDL